MFGINAQEIHIEWTHKLHPETQESSWVFYSLSSISNPSVGSFLNCIFSHSLPSSSLPIPHARPPSPLSGELHQPPWALPSLTVFLCILHQSARSMILKPSHIRSFCCLNSKFSNLSTFYHVPHSPVLIGTSYFILILTHATFLLIYHALIVSSLVYRWMPRSWCRAVQKRWFISLC